MTLGKAWSQTGPLPQPSGCHGKQGGKLRGAELGWAGRDGGAGLQAGDVLRTTRGPLSPGLGPWFEEDGGWGS